MYENCSNVPFKNLVKFMQKCSEVPSKNKETQFKAFLQYCVPRPSPDIFQIFRLLLPAEDAERVRYGLKEDKLAALLVKAAGLNEDSTNAKAAKNWKKGHVQNAGIFPEVMEQYVLRNACVAAADAEATTVAEVNSLLDRLAAAADFKQQIPVMREVYQRCSAPQVKWLLRIILKDLKIGMSKERMLRLFHPDAIDMLNITNSLQQVCEELASPTHRMARKDIMPGCAIKMQLCLRANSLEEAFHRMKGKPFTTEVKLDGYRMQVHVTQQEVMYFSRRGREHGRLSNYTVFDKVVREQVKLQGTEDAVILDGEVVVWNKTRGVFEAFGGVRSAMNAARERLPPDHVLGTKFEEDRPEDEITAVGAQEDSLKQQQQDEGPAEDIAATVADVELVYFAFDILYCGKESVINRPLHERQQLLQDAIRCIPADVPGVPCNDSYIGGRVVALLPDQAVPLPIAGAAAEQQPGGAAAMSCAAVPGLVLSRTGRTLDDVQRMYDVAISRQDEGIVVKQLESPWKPDDRSGVWLKMKPDYIEQAEIDAVVIAAYYGAGRRGGQISEFLLALTDPGASGVWVSFCKVATGIKDIERQQLWDRLSPVLVRNGPGVKPPRCYRLSGKEERPDFWISDPRRSVVLEVKSDVRTIISKTFAIPYSLRFPRVTKICWDRAGDDIASCLDVERLVADNKGRLTDRQMGVGPRGVAGVGGKSAAKRKGAARRTQRSAVVGVAQLPDVSTVEEQSAALAGKEVCVLNYCHDTASRAELDAAKQEIGAIIKRNGGRQVVAPRPQTDYILAAFLSESRARTLRATEGSSSTNAQRAYDVVALEWLREVDKAKQLLSIMPRHRLYLTAASRLALAAAGAGDHDTYGNPFLLELKAADVAALVSRLIPDSELTKFQGHLLKGEEQLQQQLERSATLELAASEPPGAAAADDALNNTSSTALDTPRSVVLDVQQQLQLETEWSDSSTTLFAQCCLLFIPYIPQPHILNTQGSAEAGQAAGFSAAGGLAADAVNPAVQLSAAGTAAAAASSTVAKRTAGNTADVVLLDCTKEGQAVAAAWRHKLAHQLLADIKLAVMLHGGSVAETYNRQVTHVVLWPVGLQQEQELQQWLLQASSSSSQDVPGSGALIWPKALLPGLQQQQPLHLSAQQLLQQLAAVAEAAAEAAAAAAAAAATQQAHPLGRKAQPRFSRLRPAAPPPPAARNGSSGGFGLVGLGSQGAAGSGLGLGSPGFNGTQGKGPGFSQLAPPGLLANHQIVAAAAAAAGGERHVKTPEQETGARNEAAAGGAAALQQQQLSPAGLKQLRLIRRRLVAAQRSSSRPAALTPIAPGNAATSLSDSKHNSNTSRARQAPAVLNLVGAAWVVDSLADLKQLQEQQQQQQQQQRGQVLIQRRSEVLYEPAVLLRQQQQQQQVEPKAEGGGCAPAPAAAAAAREAEGLVAAADVRRWPWDLVGVSCGGGTGSSTESAGGSSDHSSDEQQGSKAAKQQCKRATKSSTGRRKRQATPSSSAAADDNQMQTPAAKQRTRATKRAAAAAATPEHEGNAAPDDNSGSAAQEGVPAKRRKARAPTKTQHSQAVPRLAAAEGGAKRGRGRGGGRGSGSSRGGKQGGRVTHSDSLDAEEEMSDHDMSAHEMSEHEMGQQQSDYDHTEHLVSTAAVAAAAAARSRKGTTSQQQQRRRRLKHNAAAADDEVIPESEQPPGWLAGGDSQQQQQEASQQAQEHAAALPMVPKRRLLPDTSGNQQAATGAAAAAAAACTAPAAMAAPVRRRSGFSLASMIFADGSQGQAPDAATVPLAGTIPETVPSSSLDAAAGAAAGAAGTIAGGVTLPSTMLPPSPAAAAAAVAAAAARPSTPGVPRRGGTLLSRWLDDDDTPTAAATAAAAAVPAAAMTPAVPAASTSHKGDGTVVAPTATGSVQPVGVPDRIAVDQSDQQVAVPVSKVLQPDWQQPELLQSGSAAMPASATGTAAAAAAQEQQPPQPQAPKRSLAALRAKFNL